jgi:hypothetical protein
MHAARKSLLAGLLALAVALLATPSPADEAPRGDVEGRIRFQGKPLPGGTVTVHPAKGGPLTAKLDKDGNYRLRNVPAGEVRVSVETESVRPKPGQPPGRFVAIPAKYGNPKTSGLVVKVVKGRQVFDIQLD